MSTLDKVQASSAIAITLTLKRGGTAVNISSATTLQMKFLSPAHTTSTKTAAFSTDGTDGKITYTTSTTDLVKKGIWTVQGIIDGNYTSKERFIVESNV